MVTSCLWACSWTLVARVVKRNVLWDYQTESVEEKQK